MCSETCLDGKSLAVVLLSLIMKSLIIQMPGVPGPAGPPAVIPVEERRPGPASVIRATALRVTWAVLEPVLKLKIVTTLTKVVFPVFILIS